MSKSLKKPIWATGAGTNPSKLGPEKRMPEIDISFVSWLWAGGQLEQRALESHREKNHSLIPSAHRQQEGRITGRTEAAQIFAAEQRGFGLQ